MRHTGPLELAALDGRAADYLFERLHNGKTLASHLLSSRDLKDWRAFALVARGLDEERLYAFTVGGAVPQVPREQWHRGSGPYLVPVVDTGNQLREAVRLRLQSLPGSFLTVEDPVGLPSDPGVVRSALRPWVFGDELYFASDGESLERLTEVVSWGDMVWPGLLAVVSSRLPAPFADWRSDLALDESDLLAMAESASEIWIGAYDGESYLLWTPSEAIIDQYREWLTTDGAVH